MFTKIFKIQYLPYYLTFISTFTIFMINLKKEGKKQTNETIILKLKECYTPLYRALQLHASEKNLDKNITDDKIIRDLILYKSYLLDDSILNLINDVINYEQKNISSNITNNEYNTLVSKLTDLVKREHDSLKIVVDRELRKRIYFDKMSLSNKVIYKISQLSKNITLIFFGILITNEINMFLNKNVKDITKGLGIFIVVNLLVAICFYLPIKICEIYEYKEKKTKRRNRKRFYCSDTVPDSSTYKCCLCGKVTEHVKYNKFGICKKCSKLQRIKPSFYNWIRV